MNFEVKLPSLIDTEYNIINYGATEGGLIDNSLAIQRAIDTAYTNGGGKIIIPRGLWLSGPIVLKDNINLHLHNGATLLFSKNEETYPLIITEYEGEKRIRCVSPISANDAHNIAITGQGIIDGNGHLWRPLKQFKVIDKVWQKKLLQNDSVISTKEGGIWFPTKSAYEGCLNGEVDVNSIDAIKKASPYYDFYRPVLVSLVKCDRVLIDGVTLQNSPAWNLHPMYCKNVTVRNAFIRNQFCAQNGDGLDIESCENVEVYNTTFDVGDDGICLKSGKGREARKIKVPTKNVYIHDCRVYEAHGGFVVGSETSRGINNVLVENCTFIGTDIGIRFKSAKGRGGVIEDIVIKNINMVDIKEEAIIFTMGYSLFTLEHEKADISNSLDLEDIPEMKNILMENITCINANQALKINGLREIPIHDITLRNSTITAQKGIDIINGTNIMLQNTTIIKVGTQESFFFDKECLDDNSKLYF